ncbi:MAG: porin [Chitinophagales bacterium]|nr:OprO/OprP family phosphate-selective porin [Chitinophagales bacterium]MDW8272779.1 porin [Chitinophagales bacterium]
MKANNKLFFFVCLFTMFSCELAWAQLTIGNGLHVLEISGTASVFFNHRFMKPAFANDSKQKNRFELRDAQIQLEGRLGKNFEYELQCDFADLFSSNNDPENPGLMDAYFMYKLPIPLNITAGYTKVPYGRANMVPFIYSPYFQRAELVRGNFFSRRDAGISLSSSVWKDRINVWLGMYSGMGELVLKGNNDRFGRFEYIGRIDVSYPVKNRWTDIDVHHLPLPTATVGFNARYADKGFTFTDGDGYNQKVVDGRKITYGGDISFKYRGFSVQAEIHQSNIRPNDTLRLEGFRTSYFRSGGYYIQASYYERHIRSVFSIRFDELNISDLIGGYGRRITAGYVFLLRGWNTALRINYTHVLNDEEYAHPSVDEVIKWRGQIRAGVQYLFR